MDEAARDRVQSEYESYPATLANVLLDGPCFKVMLARACHEKELVIHVIGASVDAELWGRNKTVLIWYGMPMQMHFKNLQKQMG